MGSEYNILIIEDDPTAAVVLESTLKVAGYNIWVVVKPREALELLASNNFDVVIAELRSAEMDGVQLTKAVHKISARTNVVVITMYSFISSAIEAMEAGAYGYITKPLNSAEIRIVIQRAVEYSLILKDANDKDYLVDLAVRDGLTGLFNRRYFNEFIIREVKNQRHSPTGLSILMLDIDNFKNYNDTQGHLAGDVLLKDAAKVFKNSVRPLDMVFRYGGEEFVIILRNTGKIGASIVAERLRVQFGSSLATTVSIGISSIPEDAQEVNPLIEKADNALYEAKKTGKNKWCLA